MNSSSPNLVFLILAHNEESVLRNCLDSLADQLGEQDRVHIVADRCSDQTAQLARSYGAEVFTRTEPEPYGKGAALNWWVERQNLDKKQPVIILDADSTVQTGFVDHTKLAFQRHDIQVFQSALNPTAEKTSPTSTLIALSERIDQGVFDNLRYRLGGSVRLRGTGMGFRFDLLRKTTPRLRTNVEDVELTLFITELGIRIHHLPSAILNDPKPNDVECAKQQRARWYRGHFRTIVSNLGSCLRLIAGGPLAWSLLHSLITKPRTLFLPLKTLALSLSLLWTIQVGSSKVAVLLAGLLALNLLVEFIALAYALIMMREKEAFLLAIEGFPRFVLMWLKGIALASRPQSNWLRGRPLRIIRPTNESARQSN